jgi:hypothetical protein
MAKRVHAPMFIFTHLHAKGLLQFALQTTSYIINTVTITVEPNGK